MSAETVMIIGATWEQVPLIETARAMGYRVLATDPNPQADGLALADVAEVVDPRNLPKVLEIARAHAIVGVTADECDYSHYAATFVGAMLGLPHDGMEAAQTTTNKRWMREACRQAHILQPRFFPCRDIAEARHAAEVIGFPVIVKPVDNRGAFGVHKVDDAEALPAAFLDALMNAHSREVIVEAYIHGIHITVDGCVDQQGRHHNLAIASKKVTPGAKPIIVGVHYPAQIPAEWRETVLAANTAVVKGLGITSGLTHSEYIVDERGRCFLVETANRGGGVHTSAVIVPAVSGVDVSALLLANATGRPFAIEPKPFAGDVALVFFVFAPGVVERVDGIDEAAALPGVLELKMVIGPGSVLQPPQSGAGRHGFAIVKAEDAQAVDALHGRLQQTLRVVYR